MGNLFSTKAPLRMALSLQGAVLAELVSFPDSIF